MPITQQTSIDVSVRNPLGFESLTAGGPANLPNIPADARIAVIQCSGGTIGDVGIRWRDDGTNPAATDTGGLALIVGDTLQYNGDLAAFEFIVVGAVTGINVAYYS